MSVSWVATTGPTVFAPIAALDIVSDTICGTIQSFGCKRHIRARWSPGGVHSLITESQIASALASTLTESQAFEDNEDDGLYPEAIASSIQPVKTTVKSSQPQPPLPPLIPQRDFPRPKNVEKYIGPLRIWLNPAYETANHYYHGERKTSNLRNKALP